MYLLKYINMYNNWNKRQDDKLFCSVQIPWLCVFFKEKILSNSLIKNKLYRKWPDLVFFFLGCSATLFIQYGHLVQIAFRESVHLCYILPLHNKPLEWHIGNQFRNSSTWPYVYVIYRAPPPKRFTVVRRKLAQACYLKWVQGLIWCPWHYL